MSVSMSVCGTGVEVSASRLIEARNHNYGIRLSLWESRMEVLLLVGMVPAPAHCFCLEDDMLLLLGPIEACIH